MKSRLHIITLALVGAVVVYAGCGKDDPYLDDYNPTPYALKIPQGFPPMIIPNDNPMTVEGVELGRKLFWEKKLSENKTLSCGSCHFPSASFSDSSQFSLGVNGTPGTRQAMPLINLGWSHFFFWDGRATPLEQQVLGPVPNPIEMNLPWKEAVKRLQEDSEYPLLFKKAFGTYVIDSNLVAKAVAQFMRTMISGNSRFDKRLRGELSFTAEEEYGLLLFNKDRDINNNIMGADCFHCHNYPFMQLINEFHNNALDLTFADSGRGGITGTPAEIGRFKVPTLRNIALTAPYMHDGRFATLDAAIEHYNSGQVLSPTVSPNMLNVNDGGIFLPPVEKAALKAFLLTLTDWDFINNPDFKDPNQ